MSKEFEAVMKRIAEENEKKKRPKTKASRYKSLDDEQDAFITAIQKLEKK
jgi:hypothetical protein